MEEGKRRYNLLVSVRRMISPCLLRARREHVECEMKGLWMDPGVGEVAVLSALSALGCGLAVARGDLLFVAVFGAASLVTIIEAIRRLR